MSSILKLFILFSGIMFALTVMRLLLKKRINEKNSIVWLSGSTLILIIAANPELLDRLANYLHISYPPSLLFLLSILILLVIVLYQSIQISEINEKIKKISQHIAIEEHLKEKSDGK